MSILDAIVNFSGKSSFRNTTHGSTKKMLLKSFFYIRSLKKRDLFIGIFVDIKFLQDF